MANDDDVALDATMQGGSGQRLQFTPEEKEEPRALGPAGRPQTLDDVFDAWFDGFNEGRDGARAVPRDGYISLLDAKLRLDDFNAHNVAGAHVDLRDVLERCDCHTRHMHAAMTTLAPQWAAHPSYTVDFERGRARLSESSDNPQNWFAVEVNAHLFHDYLTGVLETLSSEQHQQLQDRQPAPPPVAQAPVAADPRGDEDLLPAGESDLCPTGGYRVVLTPAGFVPVWYGRPSRSEAEAVADAWRHDEGRKR